MFVEADQILNVILLLNLSQGSSMVALIEDNDNIVPVMYVLELLFLN